MKSEILVKSTAELKDELEQMDANCEDKSISEILDDEGELRPDGVSGSNNEDNEPNP